jgi:membrane associated rhomboid family serine protease
VPLSDRDYMKPSPPPKRRSWRPPGYSSFNLDPVWTLIGLNLVFFLATTIRSDLVYTLGFAPPLFLERPWTLLTSLFVHANITHILFNMLALYYFGRMLNMIIGQTKFLLLYFIGGIVGNLLFMVLNLSSNANLFGASGAVYAVAGALVVMMPKLRVNFWGIIPMPLWVFVVIFMGLLSLPPFVDIQIAWQAHMGGLASGLLAGYIFKKSGRYHYYR